MECCACLSHLRRVHLSVNLWTVAHQAPPFTGFFRQEYWNGWPCPPPGDLPDPRIKPVSIMSPALAGRFFSTNITWEWNTTQPLKKNKVMSFVATGMDPEIIKLSESQVRMRKTNTVWYYMQNLKKKKKRYKWTCLQNRNRVTDFENKFRQWIKLGVWDWHTHTTIYKTDNQQGLTGYHRKLYSIFSNILHMGKII